jgi:hypothetical protein
MDSPLNQTTESPTKELATLIGESYRTSLDTLPPQSPNWKAFRNSCRSERPISCPQESQVNVASLDDINTYNEVLTQENVSISLRKPVVLTPRQPIADYLHAESCYHIFCLVTSLFNVLSLWNFTCNPPNVIFAVRLDVQSSSQSRPQRWSGGFGHV